MNFAREKELFMLKHGLSLLSEDPTVRKQMTKDATPLARYARVAVWKVLNILTVEFMDNMMTICVTPLHGEPFFLRIPTLMSVHAFLEACRAKGIKVDTVGFDARPPLEEQVRDFADWVLE